jgi:phi13 family phage major tail protein
MATIGVSRPYFGIYTNTDGVITYTGGAVFAKAIEFSAKIESGTDNNLYADNGIAETDRGFAGGTISVTTDEISQAASAAILGITPRTITIGEETGVSELVYDDDMGAPDLGFGIIIKKKVSGTDKYRAVFFHKIKFDIPEDAATTQGETIEWQTPTIEGTVMRDDGTKHGWKSEVTVDTEAIAEAYLKQKLGIVAKSAPVTSSVASGTYNTAQNVTLSTTEAAGAIYYTDDGTIPSSDNSNSILYAAPIALEAPSNTCIKAVCEVAGKTDSDILELYITVTE